MTGAHGTGIGTGAGVTRVLGAVLAGGASSRFGSPKALATVGGVRVVDRVADALRAAGVSDVVAIVNDAALAALIALPSRADVLHGIGALAGVHAALVEAHDRGCDGVLAAACDMPFLEPALLRLLVDNARDTDAVLPASDGPRGLEPLCAYYAVSCIPAIEDAAARGDGRLVGFHDRIRVAVLPAELVRTAGDPSLMFRNMNAPADHAAAESALRGDAGGHA